MVHSTSSSLIINKIQFLSVSPLISQYTRDQVINDHYIIITSLKANRFVTSHSCGTS